MTVRRLAINVVYPDLGVLSGQLKRAQVWNKGSWFLGCCLEPLVNEETASPSFWRL